MKNTNFKITQHVTLDENYNVVHYIEKRNDVILYWERFYIENNEVIYGEDSNNFKYLYENGKKIRKQLLSFDSAPHLGGGGGSGCAVPDVSEAFSAALLELMNEETIIR